MGRFKSKSPAIPADSQQPRTIRSRIRPRSRLTYASGTIFCAAQHKDSNMDTIPEVESPEPVESPITAGSDEDLVEVGAVSETKGGIFGITNDAGPGRTWA
jgi:hypothetical protein